MKMEITATVDSRGYVKRQYMGKSGHRYRRREKNGQGSVI
jgi:hypothetical protein